MKIAHRGASRLEPENTLRAFEKAVEIGAQMIEFDVWRCGTGEIVIIHDDHLPGDEGPDRHIERLPLLDIKRVDVGKGERVPTLSEVLNTFAGRIALNIELKGRGTAAPVAELITKELTEGRWKAEDLMISSFNLRELRRSQKLLPQVPHALLLSGHRFQKLKKRWGVELASKMKVQAINISENLATKELISEAKARGLKVFVWTINDKERMHHLLDLHIDGVFSDTPDTLEHRDLAY